METKGLIFIPDISGFSRFVNEMEIEHSRLIIQELLEILIDANQSGLEVSEIEGDAILFYKFGDKPSLIEIHSQVEKMFSAFHKNLMAYESRKYCQCHACLSAINLTLKVITHYGEFTGYKVKDFNKLIGKGIIVAHQLLKNDIPNHEYWLVTDELYRNDAINTLPATIKWHDSIKNTDEGTISFHYTQLGYLKSKLSSEPPSKPDLADKTKVISFTKEYDVDLITLFHATGDFNYRHRWMNGVTKVVVENHFLPRVGMRCRVISDGGETITYSSHYIYQKDKVQFSETDESSGMLTSYTLEKKGDRKTKLTMDYYISKNKLSVLLFNLGKKRKLKASVEKSLQNLAELAGQIKVLRSTGAVA